MTAIVVAVGLVTGCTESSGNIPPGAAPSAAVRATRSSTAPGPVVSGTTSTEMVCRAIIGVYDAEKVPLVSAYGQYVTATVANDRAKIPELRAKVEEIIKRLSRAARAELAKATDSQFKAALSDYIAVAEEVYLTPAEDAALDAELHRVVTAAHQYCPTLGT
ncbi:hypothetical protein [Dactylosporangium sp. NPDC051541]|uniref:hypothetical protein n=1 Tax=Dactylosporangium sp. NPDC051541 TaxID=3363977 RepID=UPI0037B79B26